jgi:hypothetical protein
MRDGRDLRGELRSILSDSHAAGSAAARICAACPDLLQVSGAALSITSGNALRATVCVSDPVMARIEELQFTTGVGPCVDAITTGRPVLSSDLAAPTEVRWPGFSREAQQAGVRAIFALPLRVGAIRLGVMDLYRDAPGGLSPLDLADAVTVADTATLAVIDMHGSTPVSDFDQECWDLATFYRVEVHQATGVLMHQLGFSAVEALATLRARAYTSGLPVVELARQIVAGAVAEPRNSGRPASNDPDG